MPAIKTPKIISLKIPMPHERVLIATESGKNEEAVAPLVISASRATDIPAFFSQWFFNRLEKGYCAWRNPFNGKKYWVSFKNTRAIVFWSKNPLPLLPYLPILEKKNIACYFQFTLNDYEEEGLEPYVPPLSQRLETFRLFSQKLGPERMVWRWDPLVLTRNTTPEILLEKIRRVGDALKHKTKKLVFSFADVHNYAKVKKNLALHLGGMDEAIRAEPTPGQQKYLARGLTSIRDSWQKSGWDMELAACAEEPNLSELGITKSHCIDSALIGRLCTVYSRQITLPGMPDYPGIDLPPDKNQRGGCSCAESKDIGAYSTCRHFCLYCYANASRDKVKKNLRNYNPESECLPG